MEQKKLLIYVEGEVDKVIVENLLIAAKLNSKVEILVCGGKQNVLESASEQRNKNDHILIALVDADRGNVADSRKFAEEQFAVSDVQVFCAVPTIEAWLFADREAAQKSSVSDSGARILERLPLPELIPYPKQLARNVFSRKSASEAYLFLRNVNILHAIARSPSLRVFIEGVAEAKGIEGDLAVSALEQSIGRDAFSMLLSEVPSDQVAWKMLDGTQLTAGNLSREIREGTDRGKQYVTEVLRIARDLVARKARK